MKLYSAFVNEISAITIVTIVSLVSEVRGTMETNQESQQHQQPSLIFKDESFSFKNQNNYLNLTFHIQLRHRFAYRQSYKSQCVSLLSMNHSMLHRISRLVGCWSFMSM